LVVAAVAHTFGLGPHDAHLELGGRPLHPRERRRLTMQVMEATLADQLHRDFMGTGGDEKASENLMARWSEADHLFYKELRESGDSG